MGKLGWCCLRKSRRAAFMRKCGESTLSLPRLSNGPHGRSLAKAATGRSPRNQGRYIPSGLRPGWGKAGGRCARVPEWSPLHGEPRGQAQVCYHDQPGTRVKQARPGALPLGPHQGALPLGAPPRAEPLEPFTGEVGREGGRSARWVRPDRRSSVGPHPSRRPSPLPSNLSNEWIAKAAP
jgi:hypothetical protein